MIQDTQRAVKRTVMDYATGVVDGRIVAGKPVRNACHRFLTDLDRDWEFYFSWDCAEDVVQFFTMLQHTTGQYDGQPFHLYPWQQFVVANLFGWRQKSDDLRRFRHAMISVGRGNGKSPLAAGITLYCFGFDNPVEARAECYTVATKGDQARIIFDEVGRFIDRSKSLKAYTTKYRDYVEITSNYSKLRPLNSEGKSADGLIPHMIAADELHAWKDQHKELWEKLETAMGKRRQPLLLITTTAGSEESELWWDQHTFCCQVCDPDSGINDERTFAYIAEIDDEDDELDEAVWPKANPMLEYGVVKVDFLRSLAEKAKTNAAIRHEFRRYHGNKLTTSSNKPITYQLWAGGNEELPELFGAPVHIGFDWGWRDDLAALGYCFPLGHVQVSEGEWKQRYAVAADVWIPEGSERDITREPWRTWIGDGWLRVTQGNTTDTMAIYDRMATVVEDYEVRSVAFDPNNAREFSTKCANDWGVETYGFQQSCQRYNEPTRELLTALAEGRIVHGGNPLLAWAATNMATKTDSRDYIMPVKQRSQDKIDPIVAIIMALSEAMFADRENVVSYESGSMFD